MSRLNSLPLPNGVLPKIGTLSLRHMTPIPSRLQPVESTTSPLLRFSTLKLGLLHLYCNIDSVEFRKWLYYEIVERCRIPQALAKLPPQAHRDPILTDFLHPKFVIKELEAMVDEVIKLYETLQEEMETESETQSEELKSKKEKGKNDIESAGPCSNFLAREKMVLMIN
jgi:hypothetical protein